MIASILLPRGKLAVLSSSLWAVHMNLASAINEVSCLNLFPFAFSSNARFPFIATKHKMKPSCCTMIYLTALLCIAGTFCPTSMAFQPDGNAKDFQVTVNQLHEELSAATKTPLPIDPGPPNYWFHPKMHTFGNHGPLGALHATLAPLATTLIDVAAYNGDNVRDDIAMALRMQMNRANARVVDLACGVGMSTRSLHRAFPKSSKLVGVDTSPQMIQMAKAYTNPGSFASKVLDMISNVLFRINGITKRPKQAQTIASSSIEYVLANAEDTGLEMSSFDLATIMYCFHEAPYLGRARILREAHRLLEPGATLAIVDISPTYEPSVTMLAGEPYVLEYQENIQLQLSKSPGFDNCRYKEVVPGHVALWLLERDHSIGVF